MGHLHPASRQRIFGVAVCIKHFHAIRGMLVDMICCARRVKRAEMSIDSLPEQEENVHDNAAFGTESIPSYDAVTTEPQPGAMINHSDCLDEHEMCRSLLHQG